MSRRNSGYFVSHPVSKMDNTVHAWFVRVTSTLYRSRRFQSTSTISMRTMAEICVAAASIGSYAEDSHAETTMGPLWVV